MSTTGNEFEQPGVNYPDRNDADGAEETPGSADAERDASPTDIGEDGKSHEAVGIGVVGGPDHYGQDADRDTLTVGEAQRKNGLGDAAEQRLPAMSQNNADDVAKVAGIVAQTRSDIGTGSFDEIRHVLAQRLEQTGIALPDDEVDELVRQISTGDAATPDRP